MTDVFNQASTESTDKSTNQEASQAETSTQTTEFLNQLVGEGKKYRDAEELARSRTVADEHIQNLERQIKELRGELDSRISASEVLEEIKRQSAAATAMGESSRGNTSPQLDEAKLAEIVRNQMTEVERARSSQDNLNKSVEALKTVYGEEDKISEAIGTKAKELGVTVDFLRDTAMKSPTAFASMMGVGQGNSNRPASTSVGSALNTDSRSFSDGSAPEVGSKAYFENIRRTDPVKYYSPSVQQAIMKAAGEGKYFK